MDANYETNNANVVNAIKNFMLLKHLISREPVRKKKTKDVFIYYWNNINITTILEIIKND